jgi:putative aldouronate transport system permease protein
MPSPDVLAKQVSGNRRRNGTMTRSRIFAKLTLFDVVIHLVVLALALIILYPLWFVIMASLSNPTQYRENPFLLLPRGFNVLSYQRVFENADIWMSYWNTIKYTVTGVCINITMTLLGGYSLSRKDFVGRNVFTFIIVFTMFFSGGLIPTYLVVRDLKMLNTFWAMVIPNAVATYYIILARTFFQTRVPVELQESAKLDGCTNFQLFIKVVLPLALPFVSVITLFYSMGHWNSYFQALIYITNRKMWPLQMILREILVQVQMDSMMQIAMDEGYADRMIIREGLKYSTVVVASLPLLLVYPFLQRFFKEGILVGALKG